MGNPQPKYCGLEKAMERAIDAVDGELYFDDDMNGIDSYKSNTGKDFSDDGSGQGSSSGFSGNGMCPTATVALIKRMGITGGGLTQLDETNNIQEKARFWSDLFVELQSYGPLGCKDHNALKTKWGNLCTRYKAAKRVANKSGSGGNKFLYYDIMNAEVGMRPRFTCKALVDTSASSKIQKVNVPRGNTPAKCNPPGDETIEQNRNVGGVSDPEQEHSSSEDEKRNRKARKTVQEKHLHENKKAQKFLEKTTKDRDEQMKSFMTEILSQGNDIKTTMARAVDNQEHFNNNFFAYLSSRK